MKKTIVVAASKDYSPGIQAFLASFDKYHPSTDIQVHLLNYDMDLSFLASLKAKYLFLKIVNLTVPTSWTKVWACKILRFKYVQALTGLVMLADSDMFFCDSINHWFDLAETGYIVAGANGSNVNYTEEWQQKYGIQMPLGVNYKTMTSVPTVLDMAKHGEVWKAIFHHKSLNKFGSDYDLVNIFMTLFNKQDKLLLIPSQQVTQVHHFGVKLDTRIRKVQGKLMTCDGLIVYMIHGKWWQKNWLEGLMRPMMSYAKGREDIIKGAKDSRDTILAEFNQYLR